MGCSDTIGSFGFEDCPREKRKVIRDFIVYKNLLNIGFGAADAKFGPKVVVGTFAVRSVGASAFFHRVSTRGFTSLKDAKDFNRGFSSCDAELPDLSINLWLENGSKR